MRKVFYYEKKFSRNPDGTDEILGFCENFPPYNIHIAKGALSRWGFWIVYIHEHIHYLFCILIPYKPLRQFFHTWFDVANSVFMVFLLLVMRRRWEPGWILVEYKKTRNRNVPIYGER